MRGPRAALGTIGKWIVAGLFGVLGMAATIPASAQQSAPADMMAASFAQLDLVNGRPDRVPELTPQLLSSYIASRGAARLDSRMPHTAALDQANALAAKRVPLADGPPVPAVRSLTRDLMKAYAERSFVPTAERVATLKSERRCLAQAVYHEARGEPETGQWAVAAVILNRVESPRYPDTVCGVVFQNANLTNRCQFSFACDGKSDEGGRGNRIVRESWVKSNLIAHSAYERHLRGRALEQLPQSTLYYHNRHVAPRWANSFTTVASIGGHIFYAAH